MRLLVDLAENDIQRLDARIRQAGSELHCRRPSSSALITVSVWPARYAPAVHGLQTKGGLRLVGPVGCPVANACVEAGQ